MTRERSSARDSLLPNVTHLIPEFGIVRRRTHDRPPERLLPAATPKRELRTIGLTTPSRSRLHPRASRFIRFCFPACPSARHVILAICEDVQGVYRSIPASLSTEQPDRQSAGAIADERGESLSMVAVATGFADQSHFTRTFKRVTGATPYEWHQNHTRKRASVDQSDQLPACRQSFRAIFTI